MNSTDESRKKKRMCKLEDRPTSGFEFLPEEIVLNILSRLPILSLMRFKSVCRAWHNLAGDPDMADTHFDHMAKNNPCLIFYSDHPIQNQLYFKDLYGHNDNKEAVKKICLPFRTKMPKFDLIGSCNGLLCLCDSSQRNTLFICNPFTRDYKELPKAMQYMYQEVVFGFGFHPATKEYKVVRIVYYKSACRLPRLFGIGSLPSEVQVFTLGSLAWKSIGKVPYKLVECPSQVLLNGRLHWATWPLRFGPARMLVSFDLADEQFREIPGPACGARSHFHVLVLGGCLSVTVTRNFEQLDIWVMKDYDVKESWINKIRIGTRLPKGLKQDLDQNFKISKLYLHRGSVKVLCLLKNGELLLEYKNGALVSYDPEHEIFKDLVFQGMPDWFGTVVHVSSLKRIETSH